MRAKSMTVMWVVLVGVAVLTWGASQAAAFTVGNVDNGSSTTASGQSFSASIEPAPPQGLLASDPVSLLDVTFYSGGVASGNPATYLAIMPAAFYDFNGGDDATPATTADAVAISTNSIDTVNGGLGIPYGDPLTFSFGAGAPMLYGDVVSAVMVFINGSNELTPVSVSTAFIAFHEEPPASGTFVPNSNYGGDGNYDATALFPDTGTDGFLEGTNDGLATDLSFVATYTPEPATASMLFAGVALIGLSRRRQH